MPTLVPLRVRLSEESGISLIHVTALLFMLMGFSAFITDMGVVYVARAQAQNAADAGALAGAIARAFDETADPPSAAGVAYQSAVHAAHQHTIVGEAPTPDVFWTCPAFVPSTDRCARVDVFRDATHGSTTLPKLFSVVFPGSALKVRATATARVGNANHTSCLKPFMIPDKFTDANGNGIYDAGDTYVAPGYTLMDVGTTLTLRAGNPKDAAAPSTYYSTGDANEYPENITECRISATLGDTQWMLPGRHQGPTEVNLGILLANGPVTLIIAMFSPVEWEANRNTGRFPVIIENMMGFCVRPEDQLGSGVVGKICALPGELDPGGPTGPSNATFLKIITLIQ